MPKPTKQQMIDALLIEERDLITDNISQKNKALEDMLESNNLVEVPHVMELKADGYVFVSTVNDETFLMKKSETDIALVDKNSNGKYDVICFPNKLKDSPSTLKETFGVIRAGDNKYYEENSPLIVKPKHCRIYYPIDQCYRCELTRNYFISKDHLVENIEGLGLVDKNFVVYTEDTGEYKLKTNCYNYGGNYYRYRQLAPDYVHHGEPFWFDETKGETPKDRSFGVELEYDNAGNLCFEVLKDKDLREKWSSVRDGSLPPNGSEFVSVPFTIDKLDEVTKMIEAARRTGAEPAKSCGYHVHISGGDLNYMDLSSLLTLCMGIQQEIFNLVTDSRINNEYCKLLDSRFIGFTKVKTKKDRRSAGCHLYGDERQYLDRHNRSKYQSTVRHYWINIDRMFRFRTRKDRHKKTVEFRLRQADFDYEQFNQMILLFYYMVEYAKNHSQKTCSRSRLIDVANYAPYRHRKTLKQLIK